MVYKCYKCSICCDPCYKYIEENDNNDICLFNGGMAEFHPVDIKEITEMV